MEDRTKIALQLTFLVVLVFSIALNVGMYRYIKQQPELKSDTVEVVRWDTVHHIEPVIKKEKVTKYVQVPDSIFYHDTITNELSLPVVQRMYTDDSTYTAYISGARVDSFPRLDSILTRQKITERTITNTVYKQKHWRLGIGATGGVSVTTGKPDIVVGGFLGYAF